jgi:molybdopterin-guanine dinucleotide biosynthesis protein A
MSKINAVILAGEQQNSPLSSLGNKALIMIKNKPMIQYVIDALKTSGKIDKIAVVGHSQSIEAAIGQEVDFIIEDQGSIIENILAGLKPFKKDHRVLLITSDIPLITGEAVVEFIHKSMETKADLCYPVVSKEVCQAKYPDAKRTYTIMKEGTFTGGNAFFVNPSIVDRCVNLARHLTDNRKNPLKMAAFLGPKIILGLVAKNLKIETVEQRMSKILKVKAKAVISSYPEIGNDVDKPEDIIMATNYL